MSASGYRNRRELGDCRWMVWFAAAASVGWCGAVRADEVDLSLGLASSTVLRGVVLGDLTARSMASYSTGAGWLTSLGVAALQSPARHEKWDAQVSLKVRPHPCPRRRLGWQSAYTHYAYPGSERLRRYAHHELAATLAYRDLLYLSVAGLRRAHLRREPHQRGLRHRGQPSSAVRADGQRRHRIPRCTARELRLCVRPPRARRAVARHAGGLVVHRDGCSSKEAPRFCCGKPVDRQPGLAVLITSLPLRRKQISATFGTRARTHRRTHLPDSQCRHGAPLRDPHRPPCHDDDASDAELVRRVAGGDRESLACCTAATTAGSCASWPG